MEELQLTSTAGWQLFSKSHDGSYFLFRVKLSLAIQRSPLAAQLQKSCISVFGKLKGKNKTQNDLLLLQKVPVNENVCSCQCKAMLII